MLNLNLNTTNIKRGPAGPSPTPVPVVDFSASTTGPTAGDSVTFTDLSTNTPTSWQWEFPGGTPTGSTGQNPTVTYSATGSYNVSLSAGNTGGTGSLTKTNYITVTAPACASPLISTTSLDAYYKFDGNGNDSSGNGYTATLQGTPTYTTGKFGQAISLGASATTRAEINQNTQPQNTSTAWTMTAWLSKSNPLLAGYIYDTFNYSPPYVGVRFAYRNLGGGNFDVLHSVGSDNLSFSVSVLPTDTFVHFASVWSGTNIKVYINGVQQGSLNWTTPETLVRAVNPYLFQSRSTLATWEGAADEAIFYDRALNATEIGDLAAGTCPLTS